MCEVNLECNRADYLHGVRGQAAIKTRDEEEGSNARSAASTVVPQEDADEAVGTAVADDTSPATAPVSIPQVASTARLFFRVPVSGRLLMFVFGWHWCCTPHHSLSIAFLMLVRKDAASVFGCILRVFLVLKRIWSAGNCHTVDRRRRIQLSALRPSPDIPLCRRRRL